jgi:hypothetical protein
VYFFAGGDQNITGIPGGPFGTGGIAEVDRQPPVIEGGADDP